MKRGFLFLVFLLGSATWSVGLDGSLEGVFSDLSSDARKPQSLPLDKLLALLKVGAERGYNAFDLLNEGILALKARNLRVVVLGDSLRAAAKIYRFGDHRVQTLLPVEKVVYLAMGTSFKGEPELSIVLTEPYTRFLELGDFYLDAQYGFRKVVPKKFDQPYGMKVKWGFFISDLSSIERVPDPQNEGNPNYIGINVFLSPKAKRWHIDPIRPW